MSQVGAGLCVSAHGADDGRSRPIVLVHGAMDRARSFRRTLEHLSDFSVTVYDRRGYGGSLAVDPPSSLDDHVADLLAVIGDRRVTVVAHSFGAHVAVRAAIAEPDRIACLGLWEPPVPWMDFWPAQARRHVEVIAASDDPGEVGERALKAMIGDDAWARLPEDVKVRRRAEGAAFVVDMASELSAPYDWADLAVPCLIGYGGRTWPHTHAAAQHLAGLLGCSSVVVDAAGHSAHASHPEEFAAFIRTTAALA